MERAVTVITVEEQVRGWLAEINRNPEPLHQITPYTKRRQQVEAFADWLILPLDADAARRFSEFRRQGVRIGSLDLKIACIALAYEVTLLTRNSNDFSQVPGLRFENWLDWVVEESSLRYRIASVAGFVAQSALSAVSPTASRCQNSPCPLALRWRRFPPCQPSEPCQSADPPGTMRSC